MLASHFLCGCDPQTPILQALILKVLLSPYFLSPGLSFEFGQVSISSPVTSFIKSQMGLIFLQSVVIELF